MFLHSSSNCITKHESSDGADKKMEKALAAAAAVEVSFAQPMVRDGGWRGRRFDNPPSFSGWERRPSWWAQLKALLSEKYDAWVPADEELHRTLPVRSPPDFAGAGNALGVVWLGHATTVVSVDGVRLVGV
jgi:hypothetical protein